MVDFPRFSRVLRIEVTQQIPRPKKTVQDNFDWQEGIIEKIRSWVKVAKVNSVEAFRSFDKDFNGLISKRDMRTSLIELLNVKPEDITDIKLDRLFKLLSFYKTDDI
jgi:hypothetical protein